MLGSKCDTIKQEVRITWDETEKYSAFAHSSLKCKRITKKQLFSLTGEVRFAAVVFKALSSFARGAEIPGHEIKKWHQRINMSNRLKRETNLNIKGLF